MHKVDTPADMTAYIARIGGIARAIDQLLVRAQAAAKEGVRPPRFAYEGVIEQSRGLVTGMPFGGQADAPVWADAKSKIDGLQKAGKIDAARGGSTSRGGAPGATRQVQAVLRRADRVVRAGHQEHRRAGAWRRRLPQGAAFYKERLIDSTTTDMTADQIHDLGLKDVARIHAEMEVVKNKVGFKGTLQEFFKFMREDPQFFFPNTDEGAKATCRRRGITSLSSRRACREYFGLLPKADLEVKRVEPFREQPGAAQHYSAGTRPTVRARASTTRT